jgi:DNA-binding transcriptional regulator YiaG
VSELVNLRNHGRYKPDVMGLACGKVVATRTRLGLTDEEFAAELGRLLSWEPSADIVRSWERAAAAPPGDVLAACDILAPPDPSVSTDEIAIAAEETKTDRAHLLTEPAPAVISSLWDELRRLASGPHRAPRDAFRSQKISGFML